MNVFVTMRRSRAEQRIHVHQGLALELAAFLFGGLHSKVFTGSRPGLFPFAEIR